MESTAKSKRPRATNFGDEFTKKLLDLVIPHSKDLNSKFNNDVIRATKKKNLGRDHRDTKQKISKKVHPQAGDKKIS